MKKMVKYRKKLLESISWNAVRERKRESDGDENEEENK